MTCSPVYIHTQTHTETHTHTHRHTHTHTHTDTHMHTHMHRHTHTETQTHTHTHTHTCTHTHTHTDTHMHTHINDINIKIQVNIYTKYTVCLYLYIHCWVINRSTALLILLNTNSLLKWTCTLDQSLWKSWRWSYLASIDLKVWKPFLKLSSVLLWLQATSLSASWTTLARCMIVSSGWE